MLLIIDSYALTYSCETRTYEGQKELPTHLYGDVNVSVRWPVCEPNCQITLHVLFFNLNSENDVYRLIKLFHTIFLLVRCK